MQDWRYLVYLMRVYRDLGDSANYERYNAKVEAKASELVASASTDQQSSVEPYQVLLEIYDIRKDYPKALEVLGKIAEMYPNDPEVNRRMQMYRQLVNAKGANGADTTKK
jgi:hypothetical protein